MFTLVLSNIFIQLQFNLHCNDIYYNCNVTYGSRFVIIIISEFHFLITNYF